MTAPCVLSLVSLLHVIFAKQILPHVYLCCTLFTDVIFVVDTIPVTRCDGNHKQEDVSHETFSFGKASRDFSRCHSLE